MKLLTNVIFLIFGRSMVLKLKYYRQRKRFPNLKNPSDISEILISRILSNEIDKYADLADKIKVREYIKSKGLGDILLKHYGYWDDAYKINLDKLPEKFVLKLNNSGGGKNIFVCRDKSTFNIDEARKHLNKALKYRQKIETHYNLIPPMILCEELIDCDNGVLPADYKFTCINGNVEEIKICTERETHYKVATKDVNWNTINTAKEECLMSTEAIKPKSLDKMIEIAKILSSDFDFVRVDLYEYKDSVKFGELTFTPAGGILPTSTDNAIKHFGEQIRLNQ